MTKIELNNVVDFLYATQTKATYGAVADAVGGIAQGVGAKLGEKTPRNSWVVNSQTEMPTDYPEELVDPPVHAINRIVRSGHELIEAMRRHEYL